MPDGRGGELATKDRSTQGEHLVFWSPDRMEIYYIGGNYLLYSYRENGEGTGPVTPIFFWVYCMHARFGAGKARCASQHKKLERAGRMLGFLKPGQSGNIFYWYYLSTVHI